MIQKDIKKMRKAQHPFLPFFIKLEKAVDSFDILKEKKKQLNGYEISNKLKISLTIFNVI